MLLPASVNGTIGFFTMLMTLFMRFLPIINIFEVKDLLHRMINGTAKVEPRAEAVPETVGAGR
jgi:molybdopterin-containing oxidoreductase family membrane subunit